MKKEDKKIWKLVFINEFELDEVHTDELTKDEADEMLERYTRCYLNMIYFILEMNEFD
jgi:hypothetical protein